MLLAVDPHRRLAVENDVDLVLTTLRLVMLGISPPGAISTRL